MKNSPRDKWRIKAVEGVEEAARQIEANEIEY